MRKQPPLTVTIRVHAMRVIDIVTGLDQGPHLLARGYMPSGQLLISGTIRAGHSPSVQRDAVEEVSRWLHLYRRGCEIETAPAEGVLTLPQHIAATAQDKDRRTQ